MSWADVILSTPASIQRFEKEINVIDEAAIEKLLFNDEVAAGTQSNVLIGDSAYIDKLQGFAKLDIAVEELEEGNLTLKLYDSDDDETFAATGLQLVITPQDSFQFTLPLPISIKSYIKIAVSKGSSVIADSLTIKILSAWQSKLQVAKQRIANLIKTYTDVDLDNFSNTDELIIASDYLTLHLIYSDLVLGYGENEIYKEKQRFYYRQYDAEIKNAMRRMTIDSARFDPYPVISK